jgi:hypothetical protein
MQPDRVEGNERSKMAMLARGLLVTFLLLLAPSAQLLWAQQGDFRDSLSETAKNYHLEIEFEDLEFPVQTKAGEITGANASLSAVEGYTPLFSLEFNLYPKSLIKAAKLKRVILCTDLAFAGQRRNAIPDFENNTLYLDVVRGGQNKSYLRKVIHHEFFHIIDLRDDGKLYRDERWAALNPPEHQYGSGGRNAQEKSNTSVLTNQFPGFLNHYSTTGVEEDKAEIFANLMVEPEHLQKQGDADPVLKSKVEQMHALLLDFCPEMNGDFWKKVKVLDR